MQYIYHIKKFLLGIDLSLAHDAAYPLAVAAILLFIVECLKTAQRERNGVPQITTDSGFINTLYVLFKCYTGMAIVSVFIVFHNSNCALMADFKTISEMDQSDQQIEGLARAITGLLIGWGSYIVVVSITLPREMIKSFQQIREEKYNA